MVLLATGHQVRCIILWVQKAIFNKTASFQKEAMRTHVAS